MAAKNDVTGDVIRSKETNQKYRDNYDRIFKTRDVETKQHTTSVELEHDITLPVVSNSTEVVDTNT